MGEDINLKSRTQNVKFNKATPSKHSTLFRTSKAQLLASVKKLKSNEYTFIGMGDGWAGNGQASNAIFGSVLSAIRNLKKKPLFILHNGDAVFTGSDQEFKTGGTYSGVPVKSLLQLIKDPNKGVPDIPFFIVPGNHEHTGINGPLTNFRKYIGPAHFGINLPKIKTTIIGLNNSQQIGTDSNGQTIYGFAPGELAFLRNHLKKAQKNTLLTMHVAPRIGKWANPRYFQDPTSTFGNARGQLTRFLSTVRGKVPQVLMGHVHALDQLTFQGTKYTISGGAGAPLVKKGFLKGAPTPIFHMIEFTVKCGVIVKRRVIPVGDTA
ncbi:3',5'-cyclic AMP phosphodiesterase CpdA [Paenibacillus taihuensis]|uniref:3',5'-cyclic AMP phosphodiesterase CpdA n=2 Tax=Paenibacillus taihuensis TaxID=1156355 RepID=A0A3D9SKZ1_9BACL|nr:3',5'-cyclic AMP phosphodiesterase CpdA [Paenibacillus taihuensis]